MKKSIVLLLISFSFISIQFANATSGRTNSSGCHNSKKVGYHCHGAPKASSYKPKSTSYVSKSKDTASYASPNKKVNEIDILVQGIQIQLNALGYKVGKADGILGKNTISAIKRFQTKNHLLVDGKPTTDLLVKLVLANS
ncbi:MAG: peptidoglycan-binding protein [Colwellia sp.]